VPVGLKAVLQQGGETRLVIHDQDTLLHNKLPERSEVSATALVPSRRANPRKVPEMCSSFSVKDVTREYSFHLGCNATRIRLFFRDSLARRLRRGIKTRRKRRANEYLFALSPPYSKAPAAGSAQSA